MAITTRADLRNEVSNRGFSYLNSTRLNQFVNEGYTRVCQEEDWPFLLASSSGTAPLTITDLGRVESVVNSTAENKLAPLDRRFVSDEDPKIDNTGTPDSYYITDTTINVFPLDTTSTFVVKYWKFISELDDDSDTILIPQRFRYIIIDAACALAYEDDDKPDLAAMCESRYQQRLIQMQDALLAQQADGPGFIMVRAGSSDW